MVLLHNMKIGKNLCIRLFYVISCIVLLLMAVFLGVAMASVFENGTGKKTEPAFSQQNQLPASEEPLLHIRSGLTSSGWGMDFNWETGFLAVGSRKNEVLLWSLKQADKVPRSLYVPVPDVQKSERSHPVALDPKARWLAYGVPGNSGNKTGLSKIYIFDLTTAKIVFVLQDLETRAQAIRFSPDGQYLAASLSEGYGLRVWSTGNWHLIKRLDPITEIPKAEQHKYNILETNYPGLSFNPVASARVGLIMAGDTGIWCFGVAPHFEAAACMEHGDESWIPAEQSYNSVAFAPDGHRIVVGSTRPGEILILALSSSFKTEYLSFSSTNQNCQYNNCFFSKAEWSKNGRYVYAGGVNWMNNPGGKIQNSIVRWDLAANNQTQVFPAGTDTVMDLVPVDSDGVMFFTHDPLIDVVGLASDTPFSSKLFPINAGNFDMRYWKDKNFVTSKDGRVIAFKPFGKNEFIKFDLLDKNISSINEMDFAVAPVYRPHNGVYPENMFNLPRTAIDKLRPSLNGKPLPFDPHDISRDYAFLPSGKEFVWVSTKQISLIQSDGTARWSHKLQHEGFRVIIADEGRLAIVASSDGTIQWYSAQTGERLLTLFISNPNNEPSYTTDVEPSDWKWICWTPEGFYSSSENGEKIVGWLINDPHDPNNPIHYDFGTFRSKFYRPDIIDNILITRNIISSINLSNKISGLEEIREIEDIYTTVINNAPPSVELVSPQENAVLPSGKLNVCFKLRTPSRSTNNPKEVRISLDGAFVKSLSDKLVLNKVICEEITIPNTKVYAIKVAVEGDNESLRGVQLASSSLIHESVSAVPTRLLGLFVGISKYREEKLKLEFSEKDAIDMENFWRIQEGRTYQKVDITRIPDAEATKENILASLKKLRNMVKADDMVILYFAGHGATLLGSNRYLFFTRDARIDDVEQLIKSSVTDLDLNEELKEMPSMHKIVILDTCRNVFSSDNASLQRVDTTALSREVRDYWNAHAFFSTGPKGYALEREGNGVYTAALLSGLQGNADLGSNDLEKNDEISINEIETYTYHTVKNRTKGQQLPLVITPYDLAVFKEEPPLVKLTGDTEQSKLH